MEELSPNLITHLIEKRLTELQKLLDSKKKSYEKSPQGRIRISQNGGHPEFYLITERGSLRGKYLPHSKETLARQLAQKDYDARLIKQLQKEISALQNYLKQTDNGRAIPELYENLCPARRDLITPATLTNEEYAAHWQEISWTGRPFAPDAPYICTAHGERVRSKSEVIIADTLFRYNIPYRYEFPITLKRINPDDIRGNFGSSITLYPDFLCLNTRTRTEFFWEHFGLMDSNEYSNNAAGKLRLYTENGILAGRNLIITMETQTEPPSIKSLEKLIEEFLL
ncbi:hypothetical protein SAMN04487775_10434 [Treponema bryantii]|uniref:Uncharacterized protein n=1 Tax=Treponema bryantii TaxID=163 RepID=A0A1I3K3C6_9SPIR|nr:hypothetical protein [Treponema bryantii]SFI66705.1 hypothetical protein SAMN04487775_10434 [Treponema bryantii]